MWYTRWTAAVLLATITCVSLAHSLCFPAEPVKARAARDAATAMAEMDRVFGNGWMQYRKRDAKHLSIAVEYLDSRHSAVVARACEILAFHERPVAIATLRRLLLDRAPEVRRAAAGTLLTYECAHKDVALNDDVARDILERSKIEKDRTTLRFLFRALGLYRGTKVDTISALVRFLKGKQGRDEFMCEQLIEALRDADLAADDDRSVALASALANIVSRKSQRTGSVPTRILAAELIGDMAVATPVAIEALRGALKETQPQNVPIQLPGSMSVDDSVTYSMAGAAAAALGRLGKPALPAVAQIEELFNTRRGTVVDHLKYAGALALLDPKNHDAIGVIVRYLDFDRGVMNTYTIFEAIALVEQLGPRADAAVPNLRKLAKLKTGRSGAYIELKRRAKRALVRIKAAR